MATGKAIRVMIADDHPIVREGLASMIARREDMEVVAEANNGQEAVGMFRLHRPDVTLMDLRMPQMDGTEAIDLLCREFPRARFIILTTFDGDEYIYRGLRAGAKAFLLKDTPREQLLDAIRGVHTGQSYIPPEIAAKLAARVGIAELTPREQKVLICMAAGCSNHRIATDLFVTESTVKSHINSILSKLGVSDRTQAVTTALKRGLVTLD